MAQVAGGTLAEFKAQLKTTQMFYTPSAALEVATGDQLIKTMELVRQFSFEKGLFGSGAPDADFIGIQFPNGEVLGDKNNINLRFDSTYMEMARDNKL